MELRERGAAILPSLYTLAEHWLDDRSSSLNIRMAATIGIHLDLGRPPREPRQALQEHRRLEEVSRRQLRRLVMVTDSDHIRTEGRPVV